METSNTQYKHHWQTRKKAFAAFANSSLLDFWRIREERLFSVADGLAIHYVRFTSPQHQDVILLCPGRGESYVKYPELAYDLFHCGYDVLIIDHRGQGRSDRLLQDPHRGHVVSFSDYVDDLEIFWRWEIADRHYQQCFALAHSMGSTIAALLLVRQLRAFHAAVLVAPMFGILLPMPCWIAIHILNWAEKYPIVSENYAPGTRRW